MSAIHSARTMCCLLLRGSRLSLRSVLRHRCRLRLGCGLLLLASEVRKPRGLLETELLQEPKLARRLHAREARRARRRRERSGNSEDRSEQNRDAHCYTRWCADRDRRSSLIEAGEASTRASVLRIAAWPKNQHFVKVVTEQLECRRARCRTTRTR
mgnify:CR=1 FL=1